jgi:hypothetical protein
MNESQVAVKYAYEKGYRITPDGEFLNPKGNPLLIKVRSNHKYPQTQIWVNGKRVNYHLHRLAAYCKYGDVIFTKGQCVRHLDDNPLNLKEENIALGTYSENERDKPKTLRTKNATIANSKRKDVRRLSMRKLTDDDVRDIRVKLSDGVLGVDLAKIYGVSKDTIYEIKRGNRYKDVI